MEKKDEKIETVEATEIFDAMAPDEQAPRKKGGQYARINWDTVESMLRAGASGQEIADFFGIARKTLYHRTTEDKGKQFSDWQRECKASTRHLLRTTQLKEAVGYAWEKKEEEFSVGKDGTKVLTKVKVTNMKHPPNTALLIFLGKNELGQSDNPESSGSFGSIPNYRMVGDETDDEDGEEGEEGTELPEGRYEAEDGEEENESEDEY